MQELDQAITDSINEIKGAFPLSEPLSDEELYRFVGSDLGWKWIADYYRGKRWQEIIFDNPNDHNGDPYGLLFTAFNFYLPALLVNALLALRKDLSEADTFVDNLTGKLEPDQSDMFDYLEREITQQQSLAIYHWMLLVNRMFGMPFVNSKTIDYWKQLADMNA